LWGVGLNVKFSGMILIPITMILLLVRALLPTSWNVLGRSLDHRRQKILAAAGVCFVSGIVGWVSIWASYGFRFDPTPQANLLLTTQLQVQKGVEIESEIRHTQAEPSLVSRGVLFAQRHRLGPQAWLNGFLYTYQSALARPAYLLGQIRKTGWWYYF